MITETIYSLMIILMVILLILTLYYKNQAFGVFTIIFNIILALNTFPFSGGIIYMIGSNITINTIGDTSTAIQTNTYSSFSNTYIAMVFVLIALFITLQLFAYTKYENERKNEENHIE